MSAGAGKIMSVSDLAIVAALVFGWGTLSARLEGFDVIRRSPSSLPGCC